MWIMVFLRDHSRGHKWAAVSLANHYVLSYRLAVIVARNKQARDFGEVLYISGAVAVSHSLKTAKPHRIWSGNLPPYRF